MISILTSMDIQKSTILSTIAKNIDPDASASVITSRPTDNVTIHLPDDATQQQQDDVQAIFDNYGTLPVNAAPNPATEGVTVVITCNDALISADANLGYYVTLDGEEYDSGDAPVIAGIATLNLIDPVDGDYTIHIFRKEGDFASGSLTVTVNEA